MKKIILIPLLLIMMASTEAFAQIGVRAGANVANFDGYDFDSRIGLHLGAYYQWDFNDLFSVEPGLFFSQKGYKSSSDNIKENLNYIDIPVLVRYWATRDLNIFAGPQGSVLVNRKYDNNGTVSQTTEIIRGYDVAAVFGVGYEIFEDWNVQASYDLGLTSLNYFDVNVKNRVFKVSVGKRF